MSDTAITIAIEAEHELGVGDVWPDGNAPERPTAADVMALLGDNPVRIKRSIQDWNLDDFHVVVTVRHNGITTSAEAYT
jgi:hypothetical protein